MKDISYLLKEKPELKKKWEDIIFLRSKLEMLKENTKNSHDKFLQKIMDDTLKKNSLHLKKIPKDNMSDIFLETAFHSASGNHQLFYDIDSFIIDSRRCAEFIIRFLIKFFQFSDSKFKMQNFIDQCADEYSGDKSQFVKFLSKDCNWFYEFVKSDKTWLVKLSSYRTDSIHYKVLNELSHFKIKFMWTSMMSFDDKPRIVEEPKLPIFNIPINEFIKSYLFKLDFFIEQSIKIIEEKIK